MRKVPAQNYIHSFIKKLRKKEVVFAMKNLNSLNLDLSLKPKLNLDKEKLAKMKEKRPNISHVENYFNIHTLLFYII